MSLSDDDLPDDPSHDLDSSDESIPKKNSKKKRDGSSLRKAPQAPKRFKSSYICFFMAKQPEIKDELGDKATVTEVSKRSAEMWRNLPAEERAHWDNVASKDKQRYMVEKATYTGPWQVPWKRAKKDPSAPKRPMSAFLYFSQDKRRVIKSHNPAMRNTEVSRRLGEMWRNASVEERQPHVDREKREREKYKIAIAEWRTEFEAKVEAQKKAQAQQTAYMTSMYNNPGELVGDPSHPYPQGYSDSDLMNSHAQLPPSQYMGQPPMGPMYSYPPPPGAYTNYPPMYSPYPPNPNAHYGYTNGKHVMVLGPNGMPHYPVPYSTPSAPPSGYEGELNQPPSTPQYDYSNGPDVHHSHAQETA